MISYKDTFVQLFLIGLEVCGISRSLGRVNLRDCAMIPLRHDFPLVCIAGSLESIGRVYHVALLNILLDLHMEEHALNTIYREYLRNSFLHCRF